MPKRNHIISRFNGLILDIAKENLPDGVFANNTRNAHFDESGNLIGFTPPAPYLSAGISSPVYAGKYKAADGTRLFHIEDTATARIKTYQPGSTSVLSKDLSHNNILADKLSHIQRLNHIVIGTGNQQANKPVWYGKHNHTQFGQAPPAEPQCMDAELVSPTQLSVDNYFPVGKDVVRSGSFTFMISPDSPRIFKFSSTTKVGESQSTFQNPGVLCADSQSGFFWLYDQQARAAYRLNSDMVIQNTLFLTGFPDDDKIVTDMIVADGHLWFLRGGGSGYGTMIDWLYRTPRSTSNNSVVVTDNSYNDFSYDALFTYTVDPVFHQRLNVRAQFGRKAFFLRSGNLYVAFRIMSDWEFYRDRDYDELMDDYEYSNAERVMDRTVFLFEGYSPNPQNFSESTGNTILARIDTADSPWRFQRDQLTLLVGNPGVMKLDWLTYDSNNIDLYNYTHNDNVQRIRLPLDQVTSYSQRTASVTQISGFASNNIQPVIYATSGTGYFFSMNAPAKAGILGGTNLSSVVESVSSLALTPIPGGFSDEDRVYYYAFSFLYDGYMESPLSEFVSARAGEGSGFTVKIQIPQTNINRRVSALNIYRASGSSYGREEFFRQVDSISLESGFTTGTVSGESVYIIEYNDRKAEFELGPAFTSNSGIPETMKQTIVHYGMSAIIDDYMFAADCWHPKIAEAQYMLFRSQPYSICSFNWETDVLRLPTIPVAMVAHTSRLLVFDHHDMHVVDPANMVIEQTVEGMGAVNQRSVKAFTGGVFIAGNNHFSILSGDNVDSPSKRITLHLGANLSAFSATPGLNSKNALRDYRYLVENATNFHVSVDQDSKQVYVLGNISGNTIGYIYNFETQQWSRYLKTGYTLTTSLADGSGNMIAYRGSQVDYLFGNSHPGAAGTEYVAELVPFDGEDANIDKWYYQVRVDYYGSTNNIGVRVAADQKDYSAELQETAIASGVFTIPGGDHRQGKTLRVRIEGSVKVKSISIIYRPKQVRS